MHVTVHQSDIDEWCSPRHCLCRRNSTVLIRINSADDCMLLKRKIKSATQNRLTPAFAHIHFCTPYKLNQFLVAHSRRHTTQLPGGILAGRLLPGHSLNGDELHPVHELRCTAYVRICWITQRFSVFVRVNYKRFIIAKPHIPWLEYIRAAEALRGWIVLVFIIRLIGLLWGTHTFKRFFREL